VVGPARRKDVYYERGRKPKELNSLCIAATGGMYAEPTSWSAPSRPRSGRFPTGAPSLLVEKRRLVRVVLLPSVHGI